MIAEETEAAFPAASSENKSLKNTSARGWRMTILKVIVMMKYTDVVNGSQGTRKSQCCLIKQKPRETVAANEVGIRSIRWKGSQKECNSFFIQKNAICPF